MVYHYKREQPPVVDAEELYDDDLIPDATSAPVPTVYPVFAPVEELLMGLLKPAFEPQGVNVHTEHYEGLGLPLIIARSTRANATSGIYPDDNRFIRSVKVSVSAIAIGLEAEKQAAYLIEAAQHVILGAWQDQVVVPGCGHIAGVRAFVDPVRVSDFQTATNIVQYPSLPKEAVRYEQNFSLLIRPDKDTKNPYLAPGP